MNKINSILANVLMKISPSKEDLDSIKEFLEDFISSFEKKLKALGIGAEIFIGGSYAKKTLIKKGQYDIDIFVRFDGKYKGKDISKLAEDAISKMKLDNVLKIHGSRDYFKIDVSPVFFAEIIPVLKTKNPKQAENITDLSYFHVNYIKKRLKNEKMLDEIRLAKAFCHANSSYGAESYISGFSGYGIELLVYHYKSFMNFLKNAIKIKDREIIDIEKLYKNKLEIAMNMNSNKMKSPIILIDPTYRERNALAALSDETFGKFKEACKKFLKNPSEKDFEIKEINLGKIKENAKKSKKEFILLKAETDKQEGDIAGSKLVKFYRHMLSEIGKFYDISNNGFDYSGKNSTEFFFVVKKKNKVTLTGPMKTDRENAVLFKRKHKKTFVKKDRIYAEEQVKEDARKFMLNWEKKNSKKMKEMHITGLEII